MTFKQIHFQLEVETQGEGFINITPSINAWLSKTHIQQGVLTMYALHTSCSLTINENADPDVLEDLAAYMKALVPEEGVRPISGRGELRPYFHSNEGPDDMPAHVRTALTSNSLSMIIDQSKLLLGMWQSIYLWEHRKSGSLRKVAINAMGE